MNTKVPLVIVVTVLAHTSSFWTLCDAKPLWNYFFNGSEKTDAEVEAESNVSSVDQTKTVTPPTPVEIKASSSASDASVKTSSGDRFDVKPYMQNVGIARAPLGFLAGLAKMGTDGLKSVVQTGAELGSTTIDQASMLTDRVIDGTQHFIERGTQKSLDNIVPMMSKLDVYRRALSGGTKPNADKAHSITITTSSDAPLNTMYNFAKDFAPAGGSSSSTLLPMPITGVDFSQFLR